MMGIVICFALLGLVATIVWVSNRIKESTEMKKWRRILRDWNEEELKSSLTVLQRIKGGAEELRESFRTGTLSTTKKESVLGSMDKYIAYIGDSIQEMKNLSQKVDTIKV